MKSLHGGALGTSRPRHRGRIALGLLEGHDAAHLYRWFGRDLDQRVGDFPQPAKTDEPPQPQSGSWTWRIRIGGDDDGRQQRAREDKPGGTVRVFLAPSEGTDRAAFEASAQARNGPHQPEILVAETRRAIKTLPIERHMAAARLGFSELFETLSKTRQAQRTGFATAPYPRCGFSPTGSCLW